jgi:hypothetical protein
MMRTFIKLILLLGMVGPTALAMLSVFGANQWPLIAAVVVYAFVLGAVAWWMEKREPWTGVGLCLAVLLLAIAFFYFTHRRFLR